MIEFSRALHFVLCGAYLILVSSFFILARPRFRGPNLVYLAMCLLNLFYTALVILGTYGPYPKGPAVAQVLVAASLGFSSTAAFSIIMEQIIGPKRSIRILRHVVQLGVLIFSSSLLQIFITGSSWTVTESDVGYTNPYFAMILPGLVISPPAQATLGILSLCLLSINLVVLYYLWNQPQRDRLLIAGVVFSLLVALNDNLSGLDLNSWMFPLACLGPLGEIIRFQSLLVRDGQLATTNLSRAMNKISDLSASARVRSTLRHDLKHLVSTLKSSPEFKTHSFEGIDLMVERLLGSKSNGERSPLRANVSECLQLSFALLGDFARLNQVRLLSSIDHRLEVDCDPGDLSLVFLNLLRNSIEAYQNRDQVQGARTIFITSLEHEESVEVSIEDLAGGVASDVAEKIFLVPKSTRPGGQGLGLLSVRELLLSNNALVVYLPIPDGALFRLSFLKSTFG